MKIGSVSKGIWFLWNFEKRDFVCNFLYQEGDLEIPKISLFENFRNFLDFHEDYEGDLTTRNFFEKIEPAL